MVAVAEPDFNTRRPIGVGLSGLMLTLLLAVIAALGLPQALPMRAGGVVVAGAGDLVIGARSDAPLSEILVRDNQIVEAGTELIRYDSPQLQSEYRAVITKRAEILAFRSAVEAFRAGAQSVTYPVDLVTVPGFEDIREAQTLVFSLWRDRQAQAEASLHARRLATEAFQAVLHDQERLLSEQIELARRDRDLSQHLQASGLATRSALSFSEEHLSLLELRQADLQTRQIDLEQKLLDLDGELALDRTGFLGNLASQLLTMSGDLASLDARGKALEATISSLSVRSPMAGTVMEVAQRAPGAQLSPGEPMMRIVPLGAEWYVAVGLSPDQVSRVSGGQEVKVRIALDRGDPVTFSGHIETVAPNTTTGSNGPPHFTIRVMLNDPPDGLRAGLPATVILPVDSRAVAMIRRFWPA